MTVSTATRPVRQIFRFGPYQLDTGLRRLVRAGSDVPLPPKPTSFLILLLQHAGNLVPKEQIQRELWGGDVVSDSSVFQTARIVRKALGRRDDGGEYVDRHARGGYRFVSPVEVIDFQEPVEDVADALGPYRAFVQGVMALESFNRDAVEQARARFAARLAVDPDAGDVNVAMAAALFLLDQAKRTDPSRDPNLLLDAEGHALKGCARVPEWPYSWATLALVVHARGDTLEAGAAIRKALDLEPGDWRLWLMRSFVSWGEGRLNPARQVLAAMPEQPVAHWFSASVHVARGVFGKALTGLAAGCAEQDAQLVPGAAGSVRFTGAGLHWLRGLILNAQGDEDGAMRELSKEIEFESSGQLWAIEASANSWYGLGVIHTQHGRPDEARAAFEQALKRVPGHTMSTLYISPASLLSPEYVGRARFVHPANTGADVLVSVEVTLVMAAWLVLQGQHEQAAGMCAAALQRAPYGSAGWWLPVEPTLRVRERPDVWAPALAALRARAR
ncbi:MAG: tetratricopeptide repeat protein [Vicinamibacterales bacterium]